MRIAIITLPLHSNYGGLLQAYALQTTIESMGHTVSVLESYPRRKHSLWVMPLVFLKRSILKFIFKKNIVVFRRENSVRFFYTNKFIKNYIHLKRVRNWKSRGVADLDGYVVGSDQIWRPKYCNTLEHAYLDFVKGLNPIKIAYAVSFGTVNKEYTNEILSWCVPLAQQFNAISVREESGKYLCQEYFKLNAVHVLDPVMLLNAEDYEKEFSLKKERQSNKYIFSYILDADDSINASVTNFATFYGLNVNSINISLSNDEKYEYNRKLPSVENWLSSIYNAEMVLTDSFHACVFSIIFHKPFWVIGNIERGMTRIQSLLYSFKLEDRLVQNFDSFNKKEINWIDVDKILQEKQKLSLNFLQQNLSK